MKKNLKNPVITGKNQKISKHIRDNRLIQTGIVLTVVIVIIVAIYLLGGIGKDKPGMSSELESQYLSNTSSKTDSETVSSSEMISGSQTSYSSVSETSGISSVAPTPTKVISYPSDSLVSTKREGWYYSPGGKQGIPAKATAAHIALCDRYDGIWQGDTTKKKVYITMDVGYDNNGTTAKMLDIAKEKKIKITFFITGDLFKSESLKALVLRMVNEGHLVGNHTWTHPSLPTMFNEKGADAVNTELDKIEKAFREVTGQEISHYMRPPMGEYSEATMKMMQKRGYKTVFWSFAYKDWDRNAQPDPATAKKTIMAGLHNGVVYLIHAVSNTNVAVLPDVIDEIYAQGYEFGLVNDIK